MYGLEQAYSGPIEFYVLDVDLPESRPYFEEYAINGRSTYVLLDKEGNELKRWVGPIRETQMKREIEELINE